MAISYVAEFKLFAAALIWALALVGGIGPLLLRLYQRASNCTNDSSTSVDTSKRMQLLTSTLNTFAGGIFLSGACLHLLPDAQANEALATWHCTSPDGCFHWANFFFGCGFLLVLLLEVLAHALQHAFGDSKASHIAAVTTDAHERTPLVDAAATELESATQRRHQHYRHHKSCSSEETDASSSPQAQLPSANNKKDGAVYSNDVRYGSTVTTLHDKQHHHSMEIHGLIDAKPVLAFVVFIALSFHSVMEGMGIGASSHATWDILAAVLAHKSLAAFALTQELVHHRVALRRVLASIGVYSIMTPVGIALGALLVDTDVESVSSGVCAALAGGTFLFVAAMEVIPQELQQREHLVPKCAALLAGYGAMCVLSIWT